MSDLPSRLKNIEIIRRNQRFSTYKARLNDRMVFIKQVNDQALIENLKREIFGIGAFGGMADKHELPFEVPNLLMHGDDYIVTSWVKGKPMNIDQGIITDEQIQFLASVFMAIDLFAPNTAGQVVLFDLKTNSASESANALRDRISQAELPPYVGADLIDQGFAFLATHMSDLQPRLGHADVSPDNILEFEGKRTLIDYEFTALAWPRFYDLVNLTSIRAVLFPSLAPGLQRLFEYYSKLHPDFKPSDHTEQLNTVAMYRMLSLLWELATEPNQHHNTTHKLSPEIYARLTSVVSAILDDKLYFETKLT